MDSILSVRINEEVKEKFVKLAEEQGVNNKEFLDLIIKNYELNKVTADIDFVKNDVEELQGIIKRILDIYINVIDKSKVRNKELINNFNMTLAEEKEKADGINSEIIALKKEVADLKESNKTLKNSNAELKESLAKEKESLKELREMNIILKEKLDNFTAYKEENQLLKTEKLTIEATTKSMEKELQESLKNLEKYKFENENLNNKLAELKVIQEKEIDQLKASHMSEMKLKDNEFSITLQKELLQKEQELRHSFWELQSNYDSRISSLIKEKEDLVFKISSLSEK